MRERSAKAHYHAMNGSHGCLPDNNMLCSTYAAAVESLSDMFELDQSMERRLRRDGYLELVSARDGADYCEITTCHETACAEDSDG